MFLWKIPEYRRLVLLYEDKNWSNVWTIFERYFLQISTVHDANSDRTNVGDPFIISTYDSVSRLTLIIVIP